LPITDGGYLGSFGFAEIRRFGGTGLGWESSISKVNVKPIKFVTINQCAIMHSSAAVCVLIGLYGFWRLCPQIRPGALLPDGDPLGNSVPKTLCSHPTSKSWLQHWFGY